MVSSPGLRAGQAQSSRTLSIWGLFKTGLKRRESRSVIPSNCTICALSEFQGKINVVCYYLPRTEDAGKQMFIICDIELDGEAYEMYCSHSVLGVSIRKRDVAEKKPDVQLGSCLSLMPNTASVRGHSLHAHFSGRWRQSRQPVPPFYPESNRDMAVTCKD